MLRQMSQTLPKVIESPFEFVKTAKRNGSDQTDEVEAFEPQISTSIAPLSSERSIAYKRMLVAPA